MSVDIAPVRVRFAPSPTGFLHLGGLRTALFNWLYARHTGGQFILRIEDTDQSRYNPESLQDLMRGLRWLGLDWDEGPDIGGPYGPYVQSERKSSYRDYAEQLVAQGHAYRCYVTAEELDAMRAEQEARGLPVGYDRRHRNLTVEQQAAFEAQGRTHVIRLAVPLEGNTVVHDLVRGETVWENSKLPADPVLLKSDGMPTYHLAVVVDDHLMRITHIMRADEWLSSAPIHKLLFDAFGWAMPLMAHLPIILNPNGKGKISKRDPVVIDGKKFPVLVHQLMEEGYLPAAMFNFLTNIGWNFDAEREIFDREEVIERFDIRGINPKPAALPYSKLEWLNGVYIRSMTPHALQQQLAPFLSRQLGLSEDTLRTSARLTRLAPLIQERIKLLTEAAALVDWAFVEADALAYEDILLFTARNKLTLAQALHILKDGVDLICRLGDFSAPELEHVFRAQAEATEVKIGAFLTPFRVALTGKEVSPPLFESMEILGRSETEARLQRAIIALQQAVLQPT
ncbi:MAG: glutamate--tRNA ligase [Caldilineaceae bacterium]|nr:glutamate--tRNA ligase [Caldilineaceae bacterium]